MLRRRRLRRAALALTLCCAGGLGTACTVGTPSVDRERTRVLPLVGLTGPVPSDTTAGPDDRTSPGTTGGGADPAAAPTPVGLASGMTPVPGAVTCTVTRAMDADEVLVRPDRLWTDLRESTFGATETRSRHQPGCSVARPAAPDCTVSFPFTVLDQQAVVLAFDLDRLVAGDARATLSRAVSARAPQRIVGYSSFVLAPGEPGAAALSWLRAAVERCVGGRPGRLGGVAGLVGGLASPDAAPGRARSLFVADGDRAVWVVLDGGSWSAATERQAVEAAVTAPLSR